MLLKDDEETIQLVTYRAANASGDTHEDQTTTPMRGRLGHWDIGSMQNGD